MVCISRVEVESHQSRKSGCLAHMKHLSCLGRREFSRRNGTNLFEQGSIAYRSYQIKAPDYWW